MLVGLCATFGRPRLLANCLACFESQSYENRRLLALDDSGLILPSLGDRWEVVSESTRYPMLTSKYNSLMRMALERWPETSAFLIIDDDDIEGPQHWSSHAAALEGHQWSQPRQIYSLHHPPAINGIPGLEPSTGRFWASTAVRVSLLDRLGGFVETSRPTFDQENLAAWQREGGEPGRPDDFSKPSYVYGWSRSNHVSGQMGHADWYERQRPMEFTGGKIVPKMDGQTEMIYRELWGA